MDKFTENLNAFLKAQEDAESEGKDRFCCPICGATVLWARANRNNHLHCTCTGCGFMIVE